MRLQSIHHSQAGMKLGKPIYNENGQILLGAGVELNERLIRRLIENDVEWIYLEDARTEDIAIAEPISLETRAKSLQTIQQEFKNVTNEPKWTTSNAYTLGKSFRKVLTDIVAELERNKDTMFMLTNIHKKDNYLLSHSLNVCLYTVTLGIAHGYSREDLTTLGLGAILHDIGKTQIPTPILLKPGRLTDNEFELIKKHTEFGFKLLKDEANIPLIAAHCAYQHHERLDGTGYPRGITGDEIHEFAQWVAIADVYDAMTSHRVYRKAMLPHIAMETMFTESPAKFDLAKIRLFQNKIAIYPLGMSVALNSGEKGVVVDINLHSPQRPIIRILEDMDGQKVNSPYEIDLSKKLSVMVTDIGVPLA